VDCVGAVRRARAYRQTARVGNNLNQLARWANTHARAAEAVSVIAHLVSFERSLLRVGRIGEGGGDAPFSSLLNNFRNLYILQRLMIKMLSASPFLYPYY
jgi:hypothetical protein